MKIETIGSFKSITNKIIKKDSELTNFIYEVALLLNSKIQQRVQNSGKGINSNSLKKYSKKYSSRRELTGRQSKFRDLTFSGNMFQSLTAEKIGKNQVKMFFGGSEDKAKAFYNNEKTPFFGLSASEQDFLNKKLEGFAKL